jgi:hypothetical protein
MKIRPEVLEFFRECRRLEWAGMRRRLKPQAMPQIVGSGDGNLSLKNVIPKATLPK